MKLREIMKPDPVTATDVTPLGDAQRTMRDHEIRHLPVVRNGRLCGILSERDILAYRARIEGESDWWRAPVRDAMTAPPQTAGPEDSITEAAGRLALSKIGALPIVDQGKLIGLVTTGDVLDAEVRSAMA